MRRAQSSAKHWALQMAVEMSRNRISEYESYSKLAIATEKSLVLPSLWETRMGLRLDWNLVLRSLTAALALYFRCHQSWAQFLESVALRSETCLGSR